MLNLVFFFFQAEDGIRDLYVTGVQTCALPILARQLAGAGHQVLLSFSRDQAKLDELAGQIGPEASVGSPADAVAFGEVVVISVPWNVLPVALEQAGPLTGKIVIDTTNQFGAPPLPREG